MSVIFIMHHYYVERNKMNKKGFCWSVFSNEKRKYINEF